MIFRRGYILGPRADWIWFLGLPFLSIAFALACHHWLPVMAMASVGLWITIPHHFATWLRTYGLHEDWERWKGPLIIGPIVIMGTTAVGLRMAPQTLLLLTLLWDHQHSVMQQHGLARIYDFKAKSGGPLTGRFDLLLNCFLYGNLLITAPLFVRLWGSELYRWQVPVSAETIERIQLLSWISLGIFALIYVGHLLRCLRAGHQLNPIKYLFLFSSYFLWYFTAWQTDSLLVFGIAHRLMHGVQYIVIVNSYLVRKERSLDRSTTTSELPPPTSMAVPQRKGWLNSSYRTLVFLGMGMVYILIYQLLILLPLDEYGFGIVNFMSVGPQPRPGMSDVAKATAYDLFATTLIQALPVTHYYFDSFIWKVSDSKVQQGL
jgi:hypothetical protein